MDSILADAWSVTIGVTRQYWRVTDEMTPCSPTNSTIPTISIFKLQRGEIEMSFCHIPQILTIGSSHPSKINRETIVKTNPLNCIWQKALLSELSELSELSVRTPELPYISNSVRSRIFDQGPRNQIRHFSCHTIISLHKDVLCRVNERQLNYFSLQLFVAYI